MGAVVALAAFFVSRAVSIGVLAGVAAGVAAAFAPHTEPERPARNRPLEVLEDGYTSSKRCIACHPENVASWYASYHRTMTQVARTESVVGRFDDVSLELEGSTYRLFRDDDTFGVELPGGERRDIVLTTGSHRMQVYWYEDKGRVPGQLPFVWLIPEERWIPRNAAFLRPPGLTHRSEASRWNQTCVRCHTTHGRLGGLDFDNPDTRAVELGIACEACHGPSEEHVQKLRSPVARYRMHLSSASVQDVVNPATLDAKRSSQVCGQCHGISVFHRQDGANAWAVDGFRYRPGDDLEDERFPVIPENLNRPIMSQILADPFYLEDRFWSDGTVRVSGREYNGLIESPCFRGGEFSCLSCHEMHPDRPDDAWADDQLAPGAESNTACTACHDAYESDEALEAHTGHVPDSSGSLCYNCHMPFTTYGLLKAIRSHTIESPSIGSSVATGRPNACNQCHLDRSLGWAARELERQYGLPVPDGVRDDVAASVIWALEGDAGQRALMAWSFGWKPARDVSGSEWMVPLLGQLVDDPYDAVRFIAARSLRRFDGYGDWSYDFMSSRVTRARAKRAVWNGWSSSTSNPVVLVGADGYEWDTFRRLLANRDDRRVNLQE